MGPRWIWHKGPFSLPEGRDKRSILSYSRSSSVFRKTLRRSKSTLEREALLRAESFFIEGKRKEGFFLIGEGARSSGSMCSGSWPREEGLRGWHGVCGPEKGRALSWKEDAPAPFSFPEGSFAGGLNYSGKKDWARPKGGGGGSSSFIGGSPPLPKLPS